MHLVSALASGIAGAANGMATFTFRGTGTPTTVFRDFEGQDPVSSGEPIVLDANGGVEVYVDVLTTVTVQDSIGTVVREFVAGFSAPGIELRSTSFTGQAYDDGSGRTITGIGQPTTIQRAMDRWIETNGSTDWKVKLPDGSEVSIPEALASITGLFINPMSPAFGAVGDGVNNDLPALVAATIVASLIDGTIVLAHGEFRTIDTWVIPANVNVFGLGANSASILIDNASDAPAIQISAPSSPSSFRTQTLSNFGINAAQANDGTVIEVADPGVVLRELIIGDKNDNFGARLVVPTSGDADDHLHLEGCRFKANNDGVSTDPSIGDDAYTGELRMTRCYMKFLTSFNGFGVIGHTGSIEACTFDVVGISLFKAVILMKDTAFCSVLGNHFTDSNASFGNRVLDVSGITTGQLREAGNTFAAGTNMRSVGDSYFTPEESQISLLGVRRARNADGDGTDLTLNITDADIFDYTYIDRTVSTNFSIGIASSVNTPDGHRHLLVVRNTTGSSITTVSVNGSSGTFNIQAGKMRILEFYAVFDGTSVEWLLGPEPFVSD